MTIIQAIFLSIIEGLTEFLPVSSTGHLVLVSHLIGIEQTNFVKSFEIYIQLGAILSVVLLYIRKLISNPKLIKPIIIAFIPAGAVGFILYKFIRDLLLGNIGVTIAALFIGGVFLLFYEKFLPGEKHGKQIEKMNAKEAVGIGLYQVISIIPGISRSAATIVGGMMQGFDRVAAVEFSFLLAIPTILGATFLDLVKTDFSYTSSEWMILSVGFLGAFITAWISVKYFLSYIKNHSLQAFGVYRIILAVLFFLIFR